MQHSSRSIEIKKKTSAEIESLMVSSVEINKILERVITSSLYQLRGTRNLKINTDKYSPFCFVEQQNLTILMQIPGQVSRF